MPHHNSPMTPAGRHRLILLVDAGSSYREVAARLGVAISTISVWVNRWLSATDTQRDDLSCLSDRSSRPHRSPRRSNPRLEAKVARVRRRTGWGPRLIAGEVGISHQTVWKILKRLGLSTNADGAQGAGHALRVALPGRSPAHGYLPLCALFASRAQDDRGSLTNLFPEEKWPRLRLLPRDHR